MSDRRFVYAMKARTEGSEIVTSGNDDDIEGTPDEMTDLLSVLLISNSYIRNMKTQYIVRWSERRQCCVSSCVDSDLLPEDDELLPEDLMEFIAASNEELVFAGAKLKMIASNDTSDKLRIAASEYAGRFVQRALLKKNLSIHGLDLGAMLEGQQKDGGLVLFRPGERCRLQLLSMAELSSSSSATLVTSVMRQLNSERIHVEMNLCENCPKNLFSALVEGVKGNPAIHLDMKEQPAENARAFADLFVSLGYFDTFTFKDEMFAIPFAHAFVECLQGGKGPTILEFSDCELSAEHAPCLETLLTKMTHLEQLKLVGVDWTKASFGAICKGLHNHSSFRSFEISDCVASQAIAEDLVSLIRNSQSLEDLELDFKFPRAQWHYLCKELSKSHRLSMRWSVFGSCIHLVISGEHASGQRFRITHDKQAGNVFQGEEAHSFGWIVDVIRDTPDHTHRVSINQSTPVNEHCRLALEAVRCKGVSSISVVCNLKTHMIEVANELLSRANSDLRKLSVQGDCYVFPFGDGDSDSDDSDSDEETSEMTEFNTNLATFVEKALANTTLIAMDIGLMAKRKMSKLHYVPVRNRIISIELLPVSLLPHVIASFPRREMSWRKVPFIETPNGKRLTGTFLAVKAFANQFKRNPKRKANREQDENASNG